MSQNSPENEYFTKFSKMFQVTGKIRPNCFSNRYAFFVLFIGDRFSASMHLINLAKFG